MAARPLETVVAKKKGLSEHQIHLIAKALADPRRHEILQQIGAKKNALSCTEMRECQPVSAAIALSLGRYQERPTYTSNVRRTPFRFGFQ